MKNRKTIYKSIIDKHGITDALVCPHCNGEGHFLEDNTHARGGTMNPYLCDCCEGKGTVDENMIADIIFDNKGVPIIIYKSSANNNWYTNDVNDDDTNPF